MVREVQEALGPGITAPEGHMETWMYVDAEAQLLSTCTLHIHLEHLADTFIQSDIQKVNCQGKDVHRTKCRALTIVMLIHSLYTTKTVRIRCYTMLSTIFKCKDVQHTISVYIKCQEVQHRSVKLT